MWSQRSWPLGLPLLASALCSFHLAVLSGSSLWPCRGSAPMLWLTSLHYRLIGTGRCAVGRARTACLPQGSAQPLAQGDWLPDWWSHW